MEYGDFLTHLIEWLQFMGMDDIEITEVLITLGYQAC